MQLPQSQWSTPTNVDKMDKYLLARGGIFYLEYCCLFVTSNAMHCIEDQQKSSLFSLAETLGPDAVPLVWYHAFN